MRLILTGFLLAAFCSAALAQPTGEVESIGFGSAYRPACWTPMVVRIKANAAASGTYQLQVKQRDLDNDVAVFTRNITLTGSSEGPVREQRFWMYFIPQPVNKGLPSTRDGAILKDIQELIEVYLCDGNGKQLTQLPITSIPESVDPSSGTFEGGRGCRLVLVVNDGNSQIASEEYRAGRDDRKTLLGVVEDALFVPIRTRELPENVLAYDAVDVVLWLDADPTTLKSDGGQREQALEAYVRRGGHLVIGQSANWQATLGFGPLLPVDLEGTAMRDDPEPLRTIARSSARRDGAGANMAAWDALQGPFRLAVATPRDGAIVDEWMQLPEPAGRRPFIVRRPVGCGAVSWVAQDLGDPAITRTARTGWVNIWQRVFDWRDQPAAGKSIAKEDEDAYPPAYGVDFGVSLNEKLESKTKVGLYISLAVVFFIVYWLLAGPGVFFFLAGRKQARFSWFAYAAVALAATLLTVVVVRLLLRGPPELHHRSLVRGERADDGYVISRFGLYIPRDGLQRIELAKPGATGHVSAVAALPIHPAHLLGEIDTAGKLSYTVAVREPSSPDAARVVVPYRSTLKQYESRWVGPLEGRIEGQMFLDSGFRGNPDGKLTNGVGRDLKNVYFAWKVLRGGNSETWLMYLPEWKDAVTLDLRQELERGEGEGKSIATVGIKDGDVPGNKKNLIGTIDVDWMDYWERDLRGITQISDTPWTDLTNKVARAVPMLTLFDRLRPIKVPADKSRSRVELFRRGARQMDLSAALAAGGLIVMADADGPAPVGLKVQGDDVTGDGRIVYQFVLPTIRKVDESQDLEATTKPG